MPTNLYDLLCTGKESGDTGMSSTNIIIANQGYYLLLET